MGDLFCFNPDGVFVDVEGVLDFLFLLLFGWRAVSDRPKDKNNKTN